MAISVPHYTVDDLDRFPDDGNRYELLDGMLLVTPAPTEAHQAIASRLQFELAAALQKLGVARVASPGAVVRPPDTQLQPDILVYPSRFPIGTNWRQITEHWLAVEVLSPSSHVYDRSFKRDAYHALGISQVWLVDVRAQFIEVSTRPRESRRVTDVLRWNSPAGISVAIELKAIFAGIENVPDFEED